MKRNLLIAKIINALHPHKCAFDMHFYVLTLLGLWGVCVPAHPRGELGTANTRLSTSLGPHLARRGFHQCREQDGQKSQPGWKVKQKYQRSSKASE